MNKLSQRLELAANILIIIVALAMGGVLIQKYFFSTKAANERAWVQPSIGSKLNLSDINFSSQPKTLVLALNAGCRFCSESASFYKRIIEDTRRNKNVKIVAVLPTSLEESKRYLNELGLSNLEVRSSSPDNIQVGGTPTLILTNEKGEITDYWVGKLPPDKEMEVINKLNS